MRWEGEGKRGKESKEFPRRRSGECTARTGRGEERGEGVKFGDGALCGGEMGAHEQERGEEGRGRDVHRIWGGTGRSLDQRLGCTVDLSLSNKTGHLCCLCAPVPQFTHERAPVPLSLRPMGHQPGQGDGRKEREGV